MLIRNAWRMKRSATGNLLRLPREKQRLSFGPLRGLVRLGSWSEQPQAFVK